MKRKIKMKLSVVYKTEYLDLNQGRYGTERLY